MLKSIPLLAYILLSHHLLMAQQNFSRIYDLEKDGLLLGYQVVDYDSSLFVLTGKICLNPDRQCGDIVKMDLQGNIIWQREIGSFDIGNTNSVWIVNDTITITGHRNSMDQPFGFFMQQMTVDGDSLTNYVFPVDTSLVGNAFNYGTAYIENGWYLYGTGRAVDASVDAILMQINRKGELVNTKYWDDGFNAVQPADLQQRSDGSLILLVETEDFGEIDAKRQLVELDEDLNRQYLWNSPLAANLGVINNCVKLNDNRMAMIAPNTNLGLANEAPFIHFVDEVNIEYSRYEFDFEIGVDIRRFTSNLIAANNGDLIGVGNYRSVLEKETGYMYRISKEGEMLWETTYRHEDWDTGGQLINQLNDIVELEDGSLLAVGWQDETTENQSLQDLWLIRVGPDGCLYEDDCDFGQFTTSTNNESNESENRFPLFYPNPTSDRIFFDEGVLPQSRLEIYSSAGEKVIEFKGVIPQGYVSLDNLVSGMYILKFTSPDLQHQYRKIIVD